MALGAGGRAQHPGCSPQALSEDLVTAMFTRHHIVLLFVNNNKTFVSLNPFY